MNEDPLSSIVFIEIPDRIAREHPDLFPAGGIVIPVETASGAGEVRSGELSNEMIIAGMLRVLAHLPDHEHAATYRRFVTAVQPGVVDELVTSGVARAGEGDLETAEEIFRALVGLVPDRPEGRVNLAIVLQQRAVALEATDAELSQQKREGAFQAYRRVLAGGEPIPPMIVFNAGMFFLDLQNASAAREALERFLTDAADTPGLDEERRRAERALDELASQAKLDAMFQEAYDFVRIGEEERGIERIEQFLERYPDAWNAWFLLGWGLRRLTRFEEAVTAFERALSLGGTNADTWNELAICRLETGDARGAREALRNALALEPENAKIMSNFGVVELREGNRDEARRFFRSVLEYDAEDPVARQYLSELDSD